MIGTNKTPPVLRIGKRIAHASITADRIVGLVELAMSSLDNPGLCVACGEEAEGVDPDARRYRCGACGERQVYGAQELLFHVVI